MTTDAAAACEVALELCDYVAAHPVLLGLRGGLAAGECVRGYGDYYGPVVTVRGACGEAGDPRHRARDPRGPGSGDRAAPGTPSAGRARVDLHLVGRPRAARLRQLGRAVQRGAVLVARIAKAIVEGSEELARRDRAMRRIVETVGPSRPAARATPAHHTSPSSPGPSATSSSRAPRPARSTAASTALFDGEGPTPEAVLALPVETLRGVGLSGSKTASIRDLAEKVVAGDVELDRVGRLSDDEIVGELTLVRGIGRWTAEMFLIFQLGRLDVWPVDDFGVRRGYGITPRLDRDADAEAARAARRRLPPVPVDRRVVLLAGRRHQELSLGRRRHPGVGTQVAASGSDGAERTAAHRPVGRAVRPELLLHLAELPRQGWQTDADAPAIDVERVGDRPRCDRLAVRDHEL